MPMLAHFTQLALLILLAVYGASQLQEQPLVLPTAVPANLEAFTGDGPFTVTCNVSGLATEDEIQWIKLISADIEAYRLRGSVSCVTPLDPTIPTTTQSPFSGSGSASGIGGGSGSASGIGSGSGGSGSASGIGPGSGDMPEFTGAPTEMPTDMPPFFLSNGTVIANGSNLTFASIAFEDEGYYVCVVTLSTGICYSESLNLTVGPGEPILDVTPRSILRRQDNVTFNCSARGGPDNMFQWQKDGTALSGENQTTLELILVDATDGGVYTCVVSNAAGNDTESKILYIRLYFDTQPMNISTDADQIQTLICGAEAFPQPTIEWFRVDGRDFGENVTGMNTGALMFTPVQFGDEGDYYCTATSNGTSVNSSVATVTVSPGELMLSEPSSILNFEDDVNFTCSASGGPDNVFQWQRNGADLSGENQTTLQLTLIDATDGGVYTCVVSNAAGSVNTSTTLYVRPYFTVQPMDIESSAGENQTLTCMAEAFPEPTIEWFRADGGNFSMTVTGMNTGTLMFTPVQFGDEGDYYCTAISNGTSVNSSVATLTVSPAGSVMASPENINSFQGNNPMFNCTAQGGPGNMFSWTRLYDNAIVGDMSSLTVSAEGAEDGGMYRCEVTNQAGSDSDTVTLNVGPYIEEPPVPTNVSSLDTTTLTCVASGFPVPNITWFHNTTEYEEDENRTTVIVEFGDRSVKSILTIRMAMVNDSGEYICRAISPPYDPVSSNPALVLVQDTPEQPQNVTAVVVTTTGVVLEWVEPHDNNAPILGYRVSYTRPLFLDGLEVTVNSSVERVNITGLHPGFTYTFIVIAFNELGDSSPSDNLMVTTIETAPTASPESVSVEAISSTEIRVAWEEVAEVNRRGVITQYEVMYEPLMTFDMLTTLTVNTTNLSITLMDLEEYVEYSISVRAYTSVGPGPYSEEIDDQTLEDAPASPPQNVTATVLSPTEIQVDWIEVPEIDQNGPIIQYEVMYEPLMIFGVLTTLTVNTTNMSITLIKLEEYVEYIISVRAYTSVGPGPYSEGIVNRTFEDTHASPPQNVTATVLSSTELQVNWTEAREIDQNGVITGYEVMYEPLMTFGVLTTRRNTTNASDLYITLTGLEEYVEYNISVRAYTSVGPGPYSVGIVNRTFEDSPASPPQDVVTLVLSSTEIEVNWREVMAIDQNGIITVYEVQYEPLMTFGVLTTLTVNTTSLSITLMDLEEYVEYNISVRAYTSVGPGPYSVGIVNRTFEDAPVSSPQNVTATVLSSTEIQVDWTEVPEIDQNGVITQYEVMYEPLMTFGMLTTLTVNTTSLPITLMDLEEYVEYSISVRAYTSVGPGPYSEEIVEQTFEDAPVSSPQDVTATVLSSTEIRVNWTEVPEIDQNGVITQYEVMYEPLMTFDMLTTLTVNTTNLSITLMGLEEYVEYNISVRAYTSVGPGPYSEEIDRRTFEDAPVSSPQNVTATVLSSTEIQVDWTEVPEIDQNGVITQYEVMYEPLMTFDMLTTLTVNTTNLSITLMDLEEYVEYSISVTAYTSVGPGPYSEEIVEQTFEDAPVSPPQDVTATVLSSTEIRVNWTEVPEIDQNGIITQYEVMYEPLMTFDMLTTLTVNTTNLSITLMDLEEYVEYSISVRAYTSVGPGPYSEEIDRRTFEDAPASSPQDVVTLVLSSTEIEVNWGEVMAIDQNGMITEYEVQYEPLMTFGMLTTLRINTTNLSITLMDLEEYVEYNISVRAYTSVGPGPYSVGIVNRTFENAPASPPQGVDTLVLSSTEIEVNWGEVMAIDQNGMITEYEVQYEPLMTFGMLTMLRINTTNLSITLMDLEEYVEYNISVRAYTSVGPGPFSVGIVNRTVEDAPVSPPQDVTATVLSSTEIRVNWTEVPEIDRNGNITQYEVMYAPLMTFGMLTTLTVNTTNLSITLMDLEEYVEYNISVRAYTSVGPGPYSEEIDEQTFEDAPASSPQDVVTLVLSSTEIEVNWGEVMTIDQNGMITEYEVQYEPLMTFGMLTTLRINTTNLSITLMNLEEYVEYNISVRAYTSVGPGPYSVGIVNRTVEDAPVSPPQDVTATVLSSTEIRVDWIEVSEIDRNGNITQYEVMYEPLITFGMLTTLTVNTTNLSITLMDLEEYVEYNISVRAYTSVGPGPYSEEIDRRTFEDAPASPPQDVVTLVLSSTEIEVNWREVMAINQNGIITEYEVQYEPLMTFGMLTTLRINTTNLSITLMDLEEYVEYNISVRAYTSVGPGPYSVGIVNRTFEDAPASPPQNVAATVLSPTEILVDWTEVPEIDQNGVITQYEVMYEPLMTFDVLTTLTVNTTSLSITLMDLEEYVEYNISVRAYTSVGPGPYSEGIVNRTFEDAHASSPRNVAATVLSSTEIQVDWTEAREIDQNGVITGYEVMYEPLMTFGVLTTRRNTTNASDLYITLTGLEEFVEYNISVRAYTSVGPGPYSVGIVNRTFEDAPASPPQNVTTTVMSSTEIQVDWTEVLEIDQNGVITQYEVMYFGNLITLTVNTTSLSITLMDLEEYVEYNISVRAYTSVGPGPYSVGIVNRTFEDIPAGVDQPPEVNRLNITAFSANVSWKPPSDPNGEITQYIVNFVLLSNERSRRSRRQASSINNNCISGGTDNIDRNIILPGNPPLTSLMLPDLTPYSQYEFRVQAFTRVGPGPFSPAMTFLTPEHVPSRPVNLNVSPVSSTALQATWDPPQCNFGIRIGYRVFHKAIMGEVDPLGNISSLGSSIDITSSNITITELAPSTNYTVTVCALTSVGCGPTDIDTAQTALPFSPAGLAIGLLIIIAVIVLVVILAVVFIRFRKKKGYTVPHAYNPQALSLQESLPSKKAEAAEPISYTSSIIENPLAAAEHTGTHEPVPVEEFPDHVKTLHANDDYLFTEEYANVEPRQSPTSEATRRPYNIAKNRYANITAYDHSRVKLLPIPGEEGSDYINANYIDGYRSSNTFIAAQGPVPASLADFWRMVWEQGSATIVMLTNLEEKGRIKCHKYWPDEKPVVHEEIRIECQEVLSLADFVVRTFSLTRSGSKEERIVRQYHYIVWPDHGVPEYPTPLLHFVRKVASSNPTNAGPMVVHCSAGVGRTGTFITLFSQLERIKVENTVDIFGFVQAMRRRRCYMVQTEPQYIFLHDAILEALECGITEVPARDLLKQYRKLGTVEPGQDQPLLAIEFKKIQSTIHSEGISSIATMPASRRKNRYTDTLPYDRSRCRLSTIPGETGSDYINANHIKGYHKRRAFVATQGPLPDTTDDFWRMIWEQNCATIVMLTKEREGGKAKCHRYWPDSGAETYAHLQVIFHAGNEYPDYVLREFKVVDTRDGSSLPVKQFQYTGWPEEGVPDSGSGFIDLIGQVQKWQRSSGDKPIVVHCSGGTGRTGTFVAISLLLERLKTEGVVDVFQTVRALRLQRPGMVRTVSQYEFCFKTVLEFLESFELYSNFK